ncbi:hypothetical protein [Arsukibacterium perlucidum]|uniref:hypothetical protein n=1 Tax=Arsukibacterium perlucidum TaxID=368811 RepID=UPI0003711A9D|nr:hypothetical protein [Arsukibacterium perlucidum]
MENQHTSDDLTVPYEEEVNGFTIYIEENPDRWCGGYIWSVCQGEAEVSSGFEFTIKSALQAATTQSSAT